MRPAGAELFHADGQVEGRTEGHNEANSSFSQFCKRAYKRLECCLIGNYGLYCSLISGVVLYETQGQSHCY
jgi:hypothetical protein